MIGSSRLVIMILFAVFIAGQGTVPLRQLSYVSLHIIHLFPQEPDMYRHRILSADVYLIAR